MNIDKFADNIMIQSIHVVGEDNEPEDYELF